MKGTLAVLGVVLLAAGCGGSSASSTIHTASTSTDGRFEVKIQVLKHGKQVIALVPVTINGHGPYTFALDTGASQSLVDSSVAKELDIKKSAASHSVAGITNVTKVHEIAVRSWSVGDVELPPTRVVEANLPFGNADGGVQGLLGSDMLSSFDVVTIDYANERLELHARS